MTPSTARVREGWKEKDGQWRNGREAKGELNQDRAHARAQAKPVINRRAPGETFAGRTTQSASILLTPGQVTKRKNSEGQRDREIEKTRRRQNNKENDTTRHIRRKVRQRMKQRINGIEDKRTRHVKSKRRIINRRRRNN